MIKSTRWPSETHLSKRNSRRELLDRLEKAAVDDKRLAFECDVFDHVSLCLTPRSRIFSTFLHSQTRLQVQNSLERQLRNAQL